MNLIHPLRTIIWTLLLSTLPVLGLFVISKEVNRRPGNFIRLFPPHITTPAYIMDLKYNSYYIAGNDDPFLFLGNSTDPSHVLKLNHVSRDTAHVKVSFPNIGSLTGRTKIHVVDSNVYASNGNKPYILKGILPILSLKKLDTTTYFMTIQPGSQNRAYFKLYDGHTSVLAQKNLISNHIKKAPLLLEKQLDGIFCVDGMLLYEALQKKVVYVYRYRNEFMVTDSILNLELKGKTIDTISQAHIELVTLNNGQTQLASPPLIVNKNAAINSKYLYIQSAQRAANEKINAFKNHSVIDAYHLKSGKYVHSFYLPDYKSYKLQEFQVNEKQLFAIYSHYLVVYHLK